MKEEADTIKGIGVGGAYGTHEFWWKSLKETDYLLNRDVDGKTGSERILGILAGGVEWSQLDWDWNRWRAVLNTLQAVKFNA
jgi:hypothetical protein